MVLAVKYCGTPRETYKALLAANVHKDMDKQNCVHNSPSLFPVSLLMLLWLVTIKQYRIWATDIIHAFIQSFDLSREIYIILPEEFGLPDDEVYLLIKILFGLCDAGYYCYITIRSFIRDEFELHNLDSDLSVYFKTTDDERSTALWEHTLMIFS